MAPDRILGGAAPRRILVVKLSSLGDVVLSTVALRALRRAFPAADLRVAIEARFVPLLAASREVDGIIEATPQTRLTPRLLRDVHRALAAERTRRGPFDVAIDLQGTRRSAAWTYLSGAAVKAGRGSPRPGWRLSLPLDRTVHAVRSHAEICERLGVPAADLGPALATLPADEARLDAILDATRLPREGHVLLNPFCGWRSKSWPKAKAAELASRVADRLGERVVVTGGPDESPRASEVVRLAGDRSAVSLAGRLSLGELACLARRARLMVSCDSGPMHVAAAVGTRVVALFGPTLPAHTGPWGDGHAVLQALPTPDHHEYRRDGADRYMDALAVEAVAPAVFEALRTSAPREALLA